jgi:hypothetical protein
MRARRHCDEEQNRELPRDQTPHDFHTSPPSQYRTTEQLRVDDPLNRCTKGFPTY